MRLPDPPLADAAAGIALRPWRPTPGDVAALAAAWADPEIAAFTAVPDDASAAAAERWIRGEPARRAAGLSLDLVVAPLHEGGEAGAAVLGEVGLRTVDPGRRRAEIGWWVAAGHRGRGVAAAATSLLTGWALSDRGGRLAQVWARIAPGNAASRRVAAAAGLAELGEAGGASVWARHASAVAAAGSSVAPGPRRSRLPS